MVFLRDANAQMANSSERGCIMVVLVTALNDEDQIKSEGATVLTTKSNNFFRHSGANYFTVTGSGQTL